ncbi:site-2 protease family protein [Neolewinella aurantiaca]|uniref:Site-2 protease family protein n=1 Tax=Neolewinella aurantiaca TaxID=2602767 RepID=A0A5C7FFY8_9BACT|nr:site-2 protease family protein [Neolewinella aurantiaca]TXF88465.1 site-2 protease family protein [Neolewinella aurantiaca]
MLNITTSQVRAIELSDVGGEEFIVFVNDRAFNVGPILYHIIQWLKEERSIRYITSEINRQEGLDVTEVELTEMVNDNFAKLGLADSPDHKLKKRRSEYIHGKVQIVGEEWVAALSEPFSGLFKPAVFITLTILGTLVTGMFYYMYGNWISGQEFGNPTQVLLIYLTLAGIFFFHEIGHTAAANCFGIKAKEIGFGFYFIFPVFFTDVTKIYALPKRKRIVVNLGGIYFQLIVNTILIVAWALLPWSANLAKVTLSLLVSTNTFVLLYSLNPFFRNDGYWIYSDLFNVKNMLIRSYRYPFDLIGKLFKGQLNVPEIEWPLLVFALANFTFIGSFVGVFVQSFSTLSTQFYETVFNPNFFRDIGENKGFLLKCLFFYGVIGFFLTRYWKVLMNMIRRKRAARAA